MNEPIHPSEPCSQRVCMVEFLAKMTINKKEAQSLSQYFYEAKKYTILNHLFYRNLCVKVFESDDDFR